MNKMAIIGLWLAALLGVGIGAYGQDAPTAAQATGVPQLETYIERLKATDPSVRRHAAYRLGLSKEEKAAWALVGALKDEDESVRAEVQEALKAMGVSALKPLMATIKDPNREARRVAVNLLQTLKDPEAAQPLIVAFKDAGPEARSQIAGVLAAMGAPAVEPLLAALKHEDALIRAGAATTLGGMKEPRAAEPLLGALKDSNAEVRCAAAVSLGALKEPRAVEPLIAMLSEQDNVSWAAQMGLQGIGTPAVERLIATLSHPHPFVRQRAADALGHIKDPRAVEPLVAGVLKDYSKGGLDIYSVNVLAQLGDARVGELLIAGLKATDPGVRSRAAEALGRVKDARAAEPLIAALGDPDNLVRGHASAALGQMKDSVGVETLTAKAKQGDVLVRRGAVAALGRLGDRKAVRPLIEALQDEDGTVRSLAASWLGQLKDARATDPLTAALKDPEPSVRKAAAWGLRELKDARATEALAVTLTDSDPDVRLAAARALAEVGDARAVAPLLAALSDTRFEVRDGAIQSLGMIKDERVMNALVARLKDPNPRMRQYAASGIGKSQGVRGIGPLTAALGDPDAEVRASVAAALGATKDPRAVEPLTRALKDEDSRVRNAAAESLRKMDWQPKNSAEKASYIIARQMWHEVGNLGDSAFEPLKLALRDSSGHIRRQAAETLNSMGWKPADAAQQAWLLAAFQKWDELARLGAPACGPLVAILKGQDDGHRQQAANTLKKIGAPAVEPVIAALADPRYDVQQQATHILKALGPAAVDQLATALTHPDSRVWRGAAGILRDMSWQPMDMSQRIRFFMGTDQWGEALKLGPAAHGTLKAALQDADPEVRAGAVRVLPSIKEDWAVPALMAALHDPVYGVRLRAAWSAPQVTDARMVAALITALGDPEPQVRQGAAVVLGQSGDARAVEPLVAMLKSANAQDRRSAAAALRRMGWQPKDATQQAWFFVGLEQWNDAAELGEAGLEPLTAMLNDPNPVIRQQAARVLHARGWQPKEASQGARFQAAQQEWTDRLKRGEAYEPLIAQLNHENLGMRQQAAKTLYHTGWRPKDPNQAARFIVLLEKWDEAAKLGAPACQPLIEAMRGGAEMRAAAAAKALATIGEPAVEPLLAALKTEGSFVKEWICEALITMDPPRVEPLIPLLKDPGRYTRRTAARALRKAKWEPKDTSQRAWLAMAAGEWGELNQLGDSGWEPLMAALKDKEPEIQQQAMNTLSFRRDPRALQLFLAALKGPDEHLRRGAMSGLCELVAHRKASDAQTVQALVAALRDWNCANQAVRALDMLQWQPQTAKDAVYWRLAWRQSGEIELHWADISKTLLEDLKANDYRTVENSVYAFIASGKEDMVTVLITTLNDKGEKSMAVTFFKCGQPSLSEAAKAWANSRKYELPAYPTPIPVKWGRWDSK